MNASLRVSDSPPHSSTPAYACCRPRSRGPTARTQPRRCTFATHRARCTTPDSSSHGCLRSTHGWASTQTKSSPSSLSTGPTQTPPPSDSSSPTRASPSTRCVRDKQLRRLTCACSDRAKAEDAAWSELTQEYKGRHSTIVSSLELQRDQLSRSQDKGKAKEREVSDWEPWDNELDDRWSEAATAARDSLRTNRQRRASVSGDSSRIRAQSPISARLKTLEYKVCTLTWGMSLCSHPTVR